MESILHDLPASYGFRIEKYDQPLDEKSRLSGPSFKIAYGLDPGLRDLAQNVLKTATHYAATEAFVDVQSKQDCGTVSHALCAAIRTFLKDYLVLVAQLENQHLAAVSISRLDQLMWLRHLKGEVKLATHAVLCLARDNDWGGIPHFSESGSDTNFITVGTVWCGIANATMRQPILDPRTGRHLHSAKALHSNSWSGVCVGCGMRYLQEEVQPRSDT